MKGLRALESAVIRVEGIVAVTLVLTMLALAGYNVFYRNVLVPLQKHWAHSGPPVVLAAKEPTPAAPTDADAKAPPAKAEAEGFGGDWGEGGDEDEDDDDADAKPEPKAEAKAPEPAAEGFGGDWDEDDGAPEPEPDAKDGKTPAEPDDDDLGDEEDPFANLPMIDHAGEAQVQGDDTPLGGPPPEGSFAAKGVAFIDAIKLSWIDVVLRQMVILVSFFGAMMATQRSKHINVDALSKLLSRPARRWLAVLTNALAVFVCVVLARAGADLVAISREHPTPIVPWADDALFQLMFPIGFGLVAFHFVVRLVEALAGELPEEGAH